MHRYRLYRYAPGVLSFICLCLVHASAALAGTLTLAWDPSTSTTVTGYYAYLGTSSGTYTVFADAGNATSYTFTVEPGTRYFLSVSAHGDDGSPGPLAPEVTAVTEGAPVLLNPGTLTSGVNTTVRVSLLASDPNGDQVTFGAAGLPFGLTLDAPSGVITGIPTTLGSYTVAATASDSKGNSSQQAFAWTIAVVDTLAPTLAITSPVTSPFLTTSTQVSVAGTAGDDVGVTGVSWTNARGGSGTATGTTAWSAAVPLVGGSNGLAFTARDAAGRTTTRTLTVSADLAAPTIRITSPTTSTSYRTSSSSLTIRGSAADDTGVRTVTWRTSSGRTGTATGTTSWSASVPFGIGTTTFAVTVTDSVGRTGSATLSVTRR